MASPLARRRDRRNLTRLSRSERRILLVLLTGAGRLSGARIARAAGAGTVTVYGVIDRLENAGWIEGQWEPGPSPRAFFYQLTRSGKAQALRLLGLEDGHV